MADTPHVKGKMDIKQHEETYSLFWTLTVWSTVLCTILLILMAFFLL